MRFVRSGDDIFLLYADQILKNYEKFAETCEYGIVPVSEELPIYFLNYRLNKDSSSLTQTRPHSNVSANSS
jgi:hypothetical protein